MTTAASEEKSARGRVYTPHATAIMVSRAGLPLASFWARAAAFLTDVVLVLVAYIPAMWLIKWLAVGRRTDAHIDITWDFHDWTNVVFVLLYFGLTLFWGNGRTLGKRLLNPRGVAGS